MFNITMFQNIDIQICIFIGSAILLGCMSLMSWKLLEQSEAGVFSATMIVSMIWDIASVFEVIGKDIQVKLFWDNVQSICFMLLPICWLIFSSRFTGIDKWTRTRSFFLMFIIPAITIIIVTTNDMHHLLLQNVKVVPSGNFSIISKTYGPWIWVYNLYFFILSLASIFILFMRPMKKGVIYRRQIVGNFMGIIFTFGTSLIYQAYKGFFIYSPMPVGFVLSGFSVMIFPIIHRFFSIAPVARDMIIEKMNSGIIVLDNKNRVSDINGAAIRILNCRASKTVGKSVEALTKSMTYLKNVNFESKEAKYEFRKTINGVEHHYEIQLSELKSNSGKAIGKLLFIQDITERKRTEEMMRFWAYHDSLTKLGNRKYFQERTTRELERAISENGMFGFVVIDLDRFKDINDKYGHHIGDEYLCEVANRLNGAVRVKDAVARMGGDEFTILLTELDSLESLKAAVSKIENALKGSVIIKSYGLPLKSSIGVAVFPDDGKDIEVLYKHADKAMYGFKKDRPDLCS